MPDPIPDFAYAEGPGGVAYIEDLADVRTCILKWGILTERALSHDDSVDLISEAADGYQ